MSPERLQELLQPAVDGTQRIARVRVEGLLYGAEQFYTRDGGSELMVQIRLPDVHELAPEIPTAPRRFAYRLISRARTISVPVAVVQEAG